MSIVFQRVANHFELDRKKVEERNQDLPSSVRDYGIECGPICPESCKKILNWIERKLKK
jgi:hypothetical protein